MRKQEERPLSPRIDEGLYSRQLYVMGNAAMKKMLRSKTLIIGLKGVGLEIAKNLCLAGIRSISILDSSKVKIEDLSTAFYCTEADIGDRVDKSIEYRLRALNPHVSLTVLDSIPKTLESYTAVILCDASMQKQIEINDICRRQEVPFISVCTRGLFFSIFCDFGDAFITTDENGEEKYIGTVKSISATGEVQMAVEEIHTLEEGDEIEIKGSIPKRYKVQNTKACSFSLEGYTGQDHAGQTFEQIKRHIVFSFKNLSSSISEPLIASETAESLVMHRCFMCIDEIEKECDVNSSDFTAKAIEAYKKRYELAKEEEYVVHEFFRQPKESISPIISVAGGMAAHEVLKACTSKFRPLQQFMYYHALETLPPSLYKKNAEKNDGGALKSTRYASLAKIYGDEVEKIFNAHIFVIGAGAIGCEHLKNIALLGMGKKGAIFITDMDAIERSNLNRQFLFREEDITHMKSVVAAREASVINADISSAITAYTSKAGKETEEVFNDKFYSHIDLLLNALDNIDARLYMDEMAIYHLIPMIDAGTLGAKGHTQTVVPYVTEHYGGSDDPQEKSIPLCTIRNFPHLPVHCVEWALSEFKSLFTQNISEIRTAIEEAPEKPIPDQIKRLIAMRPRTSRDALSSAIKLFYIQFTQNPSRLLDTFPPGHITDEGAPFWTPPKRIPTPVTLSVTDPLHISFIQSAYLLLCKVYCLTYKEVTDKEISELVDKSIEEAIAEREDHIPDVPLDLDSLKVLEEEFEKDSETNGHIDFVASAANIRCKIYSIPQLTKLEVKKIAGKIIPAISTTTGTVSGLALLEGIKCLFWKETKSPEIYRNNYVTLALPLLTSSEPVSPHKIEQKLPNGNIQVSPWDRIEMKDTSLEELMKNIKDRWGADIQTVMHGLTMLYCSFYGAAKFKKNLPKKISEIIFPNGVPPNVLSARVDPVIEDNNGEEVQVPFLKVYFEPTN